MWDISLQGRMGKAGELDSSVRGRNCGLEWPRGSGRRQGTREDQDKGQLEIMGETDKGQFKSEKEHPAKNGTVRPGKGWS